MSKWWKRLRGAVGNAVLWGVAWATASVPVIAILQVLGLGEMFGLLPLAPRIVGTLAGMGFVAGGAVSTYLALSPGRRLEDLNVPILGLLGGVFGAAMAPIFGFLPAVASLLGVPFPVAMAWAAGIAGVLGAATSIGTVRFAQAAEALPAANNPSGPIKGSGEAQLDVVKATGQRVSS